MAAERYDDRPNERTPQVPRRRIVGRHDSHVLKTPAIPNMPKPAVNAV